jgi:hypothetical protein
MRAHAGAGFGNAPSKTQAETASAAGTKSGFVVKTF